jgi:hypothetical protein
VLIQLPHSLHQALAGGLDTAALFASQSQFVRRASYMSFDIALGKSAGELLDRLDRRQDALEIPMQARRSSCMARKPTGNRCDPHRSAHARPVRVPIRVREQIGKPCGCRGERSAWPPPAGDQLVFVLT